MTTDPSSEVTRVLNRISAGDIKAADALFPLVYEEFRSIAEMYMRREGNHTLEPTALVHEVYIKLVDQTRVKWQGRTHFFAVGAQAMRRILVDHARAKRREKRGGGWDRIELNEELILSTERDGDVIALDDALKVLAKIDERQAKIVEMRFFAGMTVKEVADALGVSKRTVESEWTTVRAWLRRELSNDEKDN